MRRLLTTALVLALWTDIRIASATELVATRPGVMCTSSDALGKLTLNNGDSRTHRRPVKPEDLAAAAAGGCIDIPAGARVSVQQAFKNTSIVSYPAGGQSTFVIPNADFAASEGPDSQATPAVSSAVPSAAVPPGYAVAHRIQTGADGDAIVILEDSRIGANLREKMWGMTDDPDILFESSDRRHAEFTRRPFLHARIRLISSTGAVLAEKVANHALAKIEPAPIHGLPSPTFLLSIDDSTGVGGFSGPVTDVIVPSARQLEPVTYVGTHGDKDASLSMASTLHAGWRIAPNRNGGSEVVEMVDCEADRAKHAKQTYRTVQFTDGQWISNWRQGGECGEIEVMPPRNMFPH